MAPRQGANYLVCFYCGRKSRVLQDGQVREWECRNCEAVNYLDEKGQITDPPVHTFREAPQVMYAQNVSRESSPFATTDGQIPFCSKCLHNQHMYAKSIAQYSEHFSDEDPVDLRTANNERRQIRDIERSVRERYPLYCDECAPKVQKKLDRAAYTAKTDHLRRTLDRTRAIGGPGRSRTWSVVDLIALSGRTMWWIGLGGQMLWNLSGLLIALLPRVLKTCTMINASSEDFAQPPVSSSCSMLELVPQLPSILNELPHIVPSLARWSFFSSLLSSWWNPHIKANSRGFRSHIMGTKHWYEFQVIWIMARAIFWFIMSRGILGDVDTPVTKGAHVFMLLFSIQIAFLAPQSVKADLNQLFAPSPKNILEKSGANTAPTSTELSRQYPSDSLSQALREVEAEPRQELPRLPSFTDSAAPSSISPWDEQSPNRGLSRYTQPARPEPPRPVAAKRDLFQPFLTQMTDDEAALYLRTGEVPARLCEGASDMDWTPSQSEHRAFNPAQKPYRAFESFNQAPVVPESSPFWYRVPAAPITPAQRLRNPPNRPQLVGRSQEVKENFFKKPPQQNKNRVQETSDENRDYHFPHPKFNPPAQYDNLNVGFMESFSQRLNLNSDSPAIAAEQSTGPFEAQQPRKMSPFKNLKPLLITTLLVVVFTVWAEYYQKAIVLCVGTVAAVTLTAIFV